MRTTRCQSVHGHKGRVLTADELGMSDPSTTALREAVYGTLCHQVPPHLRVMLPPNGLLTKDELNRMRSDYDDKIRTHERFRRSSIANEASLRDEMKRLKDLSELEKDSNDFKRHLEVCIQSHFFSIEQSQQQQQHR